MLQNLGLDFNLGLEHFYYQETFGLPGCEMSRLLVFILCSAVLW